MKYIIVFLLLSSSVLFANEARYKAVRDTIFWPSLYNNSYKTLYCGTSKAAGVKVWVEHAYSANWIAEANGCPDKRHCPKKSYLAASSDLHNLWPSLGHYKQSRGNIPFGIIPGEEKRFPDNACDFERTTGSDAIVEPRDSVKGDIARSILYMIYQYELPNHIELPLLLRWHIQDPPDTAELWRNDRIEVLQGNRNPFID